MGKIYNRINMSEKWSKAFGFLLIVLAFSFTTESAFSQNAALVVNASTTDGNDTVNDTVDYEVSIRNTGNVILTSVNLTNTLGVALTLSGGDIANPGVLDPDEIWKYTGVYTNPSGAAVNNTFSLTTAEITTPITYAHIEAVHEDDYSSVTIVACSVIIANDDDFSGTNINTFLGGVAGNAITNNDTLNGVPVAAGDLNITTTANPENITVGADGSVNVPVNTPAGNYTITYQICEKINPTNCDDGEIDVTVYLPPSIADVNESTPENVAITETPVLTGTPIGTPTYTITGGEDQGLFTIDAATGAVTLPGQDFENPADANGDNVYEVEVTVTDADGNTDKATVAITVTDVVETAAITLADVNESTPENVAITETPVLTGTPIGTPTYTITGGEDQGLFTIDAATGAVTLPGQDFENPADANGDNVYEVEVTVTDADGNTDKATVAITVTDVVETAAITLADVNESTPENVAITETPALGGATPIGVVTYTITGGEDQGLFTIDTATGAVTLPGQDFENPADANGDNVYEVEVTVTDADGNTDKATVAITVTDVVETAAITLADVNESTPENVAITETPALGGATPIGVVTYTITGGEDQGLFTIDAATGAVTLPGQDFENPADANGDNVYEVEVTVTDADGNTDKATVAITVTDVVETAAITLADVNESTPENVAITETPALGGATPIGVVTYTITGGEDQGLFTIDAATGAVTLPGQDFENPADANGDNVYEVEVTVTDADGNTDKATVAITVTDVVETAAITLADVNESTPENVAITETPALGGATPIGVVTYTITGGEDQGLFTIDAATGAVTLPGQDFENPADANGDNVYEVEVTVTDADGNTDKATVAITVTDVVETAAITLADVNESTPENVAITETPALGGATPIGVVTYTITGGEDQGLFTIDAATGAVTLPGQDFENPADANGDNVYEVEVTVTDADGNTDKATVAITVTDVVETAAITLADVNESTPENVAITETPALGGATPIGVVTYTITGGEDQGLFTIDAATGAVTLPGQDFENPADANGDNVYEVEVTVTDADGNTDKATVAITVTDVVETAAITLADVNESTPENVAITETPALGGATPIGVVTYTITGGEDQGLFTIDAATGAVTLPGQDFENPADANGDNVYEVEVTVTDADGNTDKATVAITVTDVVETAAITLADVNESTPENVAITETPALGGATPIGVVTYTITGGEDQGLFTIDAATGAVTLPGQDFENPADANGDNVYEVEVTVTDADGNTDKATVAITVTDVVETAAITLADVNESTPENVAITETPALGGATPIGVVTYTITGGEDQGLFTIDAATGAVTLPGQDFENPADANGDNVYEVEVTVTDADGNTDKATVAITVTDVVETAAITLADVNESTPENVAITETPALGGATPIGVVTYTITGGEDQGLFTIDAATGAVTLPGQDFENPADANGDNVYEVEVTVTDADGNTDKATVAITVTDVVETAAITLADVNESTPENVAITETPVLTGTPIGTPTYTITGGEDQGLFTIDAATGAVTLPGQDFENPADANGDNVYEVEVTVTDADGNTDKATVAITVTDVVETAAITLADVNESTPENVAITETPALGGATPIGVVTYTITGGEDQGLFTIDAATGAVTLPGQDFENPADANGDNVYEVEVTVTDADGNTDKATVAITVTDVVETAAITLADVNESTPENVAITETPALGGATPIGVVTYTITGGEDQGLFTIDAATGAVTLLGQDFENPADANGDNVYEVEVTVTDADGNTDKATVAITVTDVVETAAITLADVNESTPENVAITETPALGGATPIGVVTYTITGGEDQGLFTIDAATGAVTLPGQDFENPADANGDNVYEVEVTVTDADGNTDKATVAITVTDVVETAAITLADVNESTPENVAITETPALGGATPIGVVTYTITGGEDQGLFTIDAATGAVTLPGQDFENPADANGDNVYEVEVTVTDADGNTDKATVAITVTDVVETAAITLADVNESTPENVAITETPALGGATPIGVVTYTITGGEDQGLFTIDAATGAVTLPGQDFENPADANGDNVYEVEVTVTDADGNTDKATVAITVTDVVETAAITLADVNESTPENVAITETPALGGATPIGVVTYTITGGEDQGLFTIDAATGAVTLPGQDFENPADANGDNVYEVEVTVTDADGNTDKATVAITVTDVVETAAITLADVNESTPENVAITETPALGGATPIGVVTYTITGGEDQGLFTIDAATGAVTLPGQDFENPADANGDNVYEVEVTVTDADGNTDKATVAITVTDVVETAAITLADVNESTPENVAITETPALGGATPIGVVTYTITGGEDQGLFTIDAATGAVTLPGQDFENPADANGDNVYEVEVTVTDADGNTDKATVAITVTDVVETAAITLADVNESTPENVAITETPALGGATPIGVVTYTITGGEDQGLFTIDAATGAVTLPGQDFENPADANGDNVYEVEVTVTDADGNTDKATVAITVTDVVETAAITLADVNESTPENVAITETPALGGATPIGVVTYTITGGEDQGLFTIDAATGAVTLPGQDFENPADANGDNVYEVEVTVTDADGNTDKATVAITVTDVVETAAITLADVNESTPENVAITETPALGGATPIGVVTYTITGGEDQGLFTIDAATGAVTLLGQDFENPADANGDNVYEVEVTVTDADGNTDKATVAITVTDVVETAAITLADVNESTPENVAITETPALGGATPIGVVTYTITGGEDQGLFTIDAATGAVTLPGQDFENPADANGDNVYEVEVTVTDADGNTDKATVAITVTDVVETAAITLADVNESTPENVAITETPALGGATPIGVVTYTITGGEDQGLFTIDAATGAVTLPGQDFENPADANGDNVYEVEVTVTDADGNTDKATVAITVTDVNDTPTGVDDNLIVEEDSTSGIDNQINVGINDDLGIDGGDGDNYSLDPANGPNNGTVSEVSDGVFEYIPNPDFTGNDSFTYIITDANGDTDTAIVTVTVSPVPDSQDDTVTTTEDTAVIVGIYGNDNDIPTDGTLIITDPSNGTVTIDNGGTPNDPSDDVVTYTPDADFNGTDTFDYTICDNASPANCTTSTVTVTVSPVPDSQDDTVTTTEDTAAIVGIYGNDNDIPTDGTLIITDPSNGTVTIDNGGTPNDPSDDVVTYTPDADFNGTDTFDYTICDNASPANCTTSTVIVTVSPVPDSQDDTVTTTEDTAVIVGIYGNDNDIPTDGTLIITDPSNGTVTIDNGGTPNDPSDDVVTYTPDADFNGTDTFDYTICDNASPANCTTSTVIVTVSPVPDSQDDTVTTTEDTAVIVGIYGNDNDIPTDGTLIITDPSNGAVTIDNGGTPNDPSDDVVTYTPDADFNGTDTFDYTICDNASPANCTTSTVIVTVNATPDAVDDTEVTTEEGVSVEVDIYDNDNDIPTDGDLTTTDPENGTVTIDDGGTPNDPSDDIVTYTPDEGFTGTDTFDYTICDNASPANCSTATVTVEVTKNLDTCVIVFNEFSPNGDGINDYLKIECIEKFKDNTVEIFNRWGNTVYSVKGYSNNDPNNRFEGISNGRANIQVEKKLPVGTYFYVLDLGNGSPLRKGWIYINR
ncbi:Ig-like domain-containing protein [Tenacibaculum maritimum]|uniref:Ig-like domain-containing protein n=6 Tax=Tenacibaculum maritimum TaxID=107401 RepID=UPI00388E634C